MIRVGFLGGTFDPPHRGHLALAQGALATGEIDRVLLVPCRIPPHKDRPDLTPASLRLHLTQLLAVEDPRLDVCDLELQREGPSFTIETIRELLRLYPDRSYRLIVGADMVPAFATWREAETLLELAPPLVGDRPGTVLPADLVADGPKDLSLRARTLLQRGRFFLPPCPISSTMIRERMAAGEDVTPFLPPRIAAYLYEHRCYGIKRGVED